jgi:hypothetical protein
MKYCSFSDCDKKLTRHSARGLCTGHYQQWHRGEDLRTLEPRNVAVPWLLAHVDHTGDDCLTWPFSRQWDGRGQIKWQGKMSKAHRQMCILAHGEPPEGKPEATHSCGNGHLGCVNPKHLRWGSDKDNKADMLVHGTRVRGERHGASKLTTAAVLEIRRLASDHSEAELARLFPVNRATIGKVIRRERWGHV